MDYYMDSTPDDRRFGTRMKDRGDLAALPTTGDSTLKRRVRARLASALAVDAMLDPSTNNLSGAMIEDAHKRVGRIARWTLITVGAASVVGLWGPGLVQVTFGNNKAPAGVEQTNFPQPLPQPQAPEQQVDSTPVTPGVAAK